MRYFEAVGNARQADGVGWGFTYVGNSKVEALDGCVAQLYAHLRERHEGEGEVLDTLTFLQGWDGSDLTIAGYEVWVDVHAFEEQD